MFGVRWRWNASRALTILRFRGGAKVPAPIQRMRAEDLLASVFPDQVACAENLTGPIRIPDHPLVNETIDNCLHEAMDVEGLKRVLAGIEDGAIRTGRGGEPDALGVFARDPERQSVRVSGRCSARGTPRAGRAVAQHLADAKWRTAFWIRPRSSRCRSEVWPDPRDADELHDALLTFITGPALPEWQGWFEELRAGGPGVSPRGTEFWVATERAGFRR